MLLTQIIGVLAEGRTIQRGVQQLGEIRRIVLEQLLVGLVLSCCRHNVTSQTTCHVRQIAKTVAGQLVRDKDILLVKHL